MGEKLEFAVEFATDSAGRQLSGLVQAVRGAATDLVSNVLAPISPSNLIAGIAQQGLGLNALGSNLVQGGIGAVANSRFGYLADMGAQFNADNAALNNTKSMAHQLFDAGLRPSDRTIDDLFRLNRITAQGHEDIDLRINRTKGAEIAAAEASKTLSNGSRAWDDALDYVSESSMGKFWRENGLFGGLGRFMDALVNVEGSAQGR